MVQKLFCPLSQSLRFSLSIFLLLFITSFFHASVAASDQNSGTLIVSYQTDKTGECLDRIRFWLINDREERTLYPQNDDFVEERQNCAERTVAISRLPVGSYAIQFVIPNRDNHFELPSERHITIEQGAVFKVDQLIRFKQSAAEFADVPAGDAIIGDPFNDDPQNERPGRALYIPQFAIAVFEVTNSQYAAWLNDALKRKKIQLDHKKAGLVINKEGKLICRTVEADALSQITAEKIDENSVHFRAVDGKESYPVIQVSWYGADAFCHDNDCRLPTEAEWEKASGMSLSEDNRPSKRFKYGFGQDQIDPSWANYRSQDFPERGKQVMTTPVGFYNGINHLKEKNLTHNAKSPSGAYDMSGNVWEWVDSWNELEPVKKNKIIKGGCYDSLAEGVRVSERVAVPPDYADIYTGFRIAKDK